MKKKELKNLAQRIAEQEKILQDTSITSDERREAENNIFLLASKVTSLEDMDLLDEYIQELL